MSHTKIIAAVEIGTSFITALIAEVETEKRINILGMARLPSAGIRKGEVVDAAAAAAVLKKVFNAAEESAESRIEQVYLALSGPLIEGFNQAGYASVSSSDGVVSRQDVARALTEGKSRNLPPGRCYVHHIRNAFSVDGRNVLSPVGSVGSRVEVNYWSVHANEGSLRNRLQIINSNGFTVKDVILSSLASGNFITTPQIRESGALVIDIGGGTTDWVLYREGFAVRTGVLPIGGDHFRNDIALGLRINMKTAEEFFHKSGTALHESVLPSERLTVPAKEGFRARTVSRQALSVIIHARLEELFTVLRKQIDCPVTTTTVPMGIYLTGGVSRLPGCAEVASSVFKVSARVAPFPAWVAADLREPGFASTLGILTYAFMGSGHDDTRNRKQPKSFIQHISDFFA